MSDKLLGSSVLSVDSAEAVMKVSCCLATAATFKRVVDEQGIPNAFLGLPLILVALVGVQRYSTVRDDLPTLGMVSGALVGVITGFLSAIDKLSIPEEPAGLSPGSPSVIYSLELLHIPVVLGSIMYSFLLVFERLPSANKLKMAVLMAMSGGVIVTMIQSLAAPTDMKGPSSIEFHKFLLAFVIFFLVGLMPLVQKAQKCWIICIIAWLLYTTWHGRHFDTMVWDWSRSRFPIPGSLTGMLILFLSDTLVSREKMSAIASRGVEGKDGGVTAIQHPLEPLMNGLTWHSATYVVQRISLYIIQKRGRRGSFTSLNALESSLSCVFVVGYLLVVSRAFKASLMDRVVITLLLLTLYLVLSLIYLSLTNGLFVDIVLGLTIVYTVQVQCANQLGTTS